MLLDFAMKCQREEPPIAAESLYHEGGRSCGDPKKSAALISPGISPSGRRFSAAWTASRKLYLLSCTYSRFFLISPI
jgi:hypothetical protein